MLKSVLLFFFLLLSIFIVALFVPPIRRWALEAIKALSDGLVVRLLRTTSQFESELTEDGRAEQELWREQRLRNLRGLTLRSEEKRKGAVKAPSEVS